VDADCIMGLDKQIGPLASIIRDLLALDRKPKASVPKEAKETKMLASHDRICVLCWVLRRLRAVRQEIKIN
jgi:hypothetical protein